MTDHPFDPASPAPGDLGVDWLADHAPLGDAGRQSAIAYILAIVDRDPVSRLLSPTAQLALSAWAWQSFRLEYDRLRAGSRRTERVDVTRALSRSL